MRKRISLTGIAVWSVMVLSFSGCGFGEDGNMLNSWIDKQANDINGIVGESGKESKSVLDTGKMNDYITKAADEIGEKINKSSQGDILEPIELDSYLLTEPYVLSDAELDKFELDGKGFKFGVELSEVLELGWKIKEEKDYSIKEVDGDKEKDGGVVKSGGSKILTIVKDGAEIGIEVYNKSDEEKEIEECMLKYMRITYDKSNYVYYVSPNGIPLGYYIEGITDMFDEGWEKSQSYAKGGGINCYAIMKDKDGDILVTYKYRFRNDILAEIECTTSIFE